MNWERPIKAVMFDFDGVLVDSAALKTAAYVALYPSERAPVREIIRGYCEYHGGVPRRDKIRHIEEVILRHQVGPERLAALCAQFTEKVLEEVVAARWIPGGMEFLQAHYRHYHLFIVSGTPHDELNEICRRRGLTDYFKGIVGSPTTKVEWVERFLRDFRFAPAEAVFVGDSITDYDAAQATGLGFIGVGRRESGLLPEGAEIMPDLTELAARLSSAATPTEIQ